MVKVIRGIALGGAGVVGQLDALKFQSLPYLINLDLSDNHHLSGAIPPAIGSLSMLSTLNFSGDQLSRHIPASLQQSATLGGLHTWTSPAPILPVKSLLPSVISRGLLFSIYLGIGSQVASHGA